MPYCNPPAFPPRMDEKPPTSRTTQTSTTLPQRSSESRRQGSLAMADTSAVTDPQQRPPPPFHMSNSPSVGGVATTQPFGIAAFPGMPTTTLAQQYTQHDTMRSLQEQGAASHGAGYGMTYTAASQHPETHHYYPPPVGFQPQYISLKLPLFWIQRPLTATFDNPQTLQTLDVTIEPLNDLSDPRAIEFLRPSNPARHLVHTSPPPSASYAEHVHGLGPFPFASQRSNLSQSRVKQEFSVLASSVAPQMPYQPMVATAHAQADVPFTTAGQSAASHEQTTHAGQSRKRAQRRVPVGYHVANAARDVFGYRHVKESLFNKLCQRQPEAHDLEVLHEAKDMINSASQNTYKEWVSNIKEAVPEKMAQATSGIRFIHSDLLRMIRAARKRVRDRRSQLHNRKRKPDDVDASAHGAGAADVGTAAKRPKSHTEELEQDDDDDDDSSEAKSRSSSSEGVIPAALSQPRRVRFQPGGHAVAPRSAQMAAEDSEAATGSVSRSRDRDRDRDVTDGGADSSASLALAALADEAVKKLSSSESEGQAPQPPE